MRKIKLYGELGRKFGREYNLEVSSPAEAIRALSFQIKGFKSFLQDSEKNGLEFRVFSNKSEISSCNHLAIKSPGDIRIVPVVRGANGEFRTLVGAALIAAAVIGTDGLAAGFAGSALGAAAPYAFNAGIALALGGATEILTRGMLSNPQPPEKADNKPSYAFQGAVNTTAQGHPVPVGYGIMIVGGAVISAGLSAENLLAGYEYTYTEDYIDAWSYSTDSASYPIKFGLVPANYTRRTFLQKISASTNPTDHLYIYNSVDRWQYRYYYQKATLTLRTV